MRRASVPIMKIVCSNSVVFAQEAFSGMGEVRLKAPRDICAAAVRDAGSPQPPGNCNNDGVCDPGEDCETCGDCAGKLNGPPSGRYCCGNGVLEGPEGNGSICDGNP